MSDITYYHELEQGTPEWLQARLGIVTASEVNNIVTPKGKIKTGQAVADYAYELAGQRINRRPEPYFESYHTARGHFEEEIAREIYSENYEEVTQCGFITRRFQGSGITIGASPDGLCGEDSGIEIKSRIAKLQVKTVIGNEVPEGDVNQCQTFLLVSGRSGMNFVQYSNGMPLFVKPVAPDLVRQGVIIDAARLLEAQVKEAMEVMRAASNSMVKCDYVPTELEGEIETEESE